MIRYIFYVYYIFKICSAANLEEVFHWKTVDFVWDDSYMTKEYALNNGYFVPIHNVPFGMEIWKDKMFITVRRIRRGVPSTLNYIHLNSLDASPKLVPFPNWNMNSLLDIDLKKFNQFVSINRIRVDPCNRLWILDEGVTGTTRSSKNRTFYRNPALFVYDLIEDKFIRYHEFSKKGLNPFVIPQELVVDVTKETCENAFAYISEYLTPSMLVYSLAEDTSWDFKHSFFNLDPFETNLKIAGMEFQWYNGIDGLALSRVNPDGYRLLFFQSVSGAHIFSVSTKVLQNSKMLSSKPEFYYNFIVEGRKGNGTQAISMILDETTGVIFDTLINKNGIACWNTFTPLNPFNFPVLTEHPEALVYPNELKIDETRRNLYILTNKLPKIFYAKFSAVEVNFRIFRVNIDDFIRHTSCEPYPHNYYF